MDRQVIKQALFLQKVQIELLENARQARQAANDFSHAGFTFTGFRLSKEEFATIDAFRKIAARIEQECQEAINNPAILQAEAQS